MNHNELTDFRYESLWRLYSAEMPDFLARLSETPPMQRLKQIGMNCGCEYVALHANDMCRRYTRFEHSVGVALIVWYFTHDARQAIAGLFHDISTPAFAHVVDFLNGDHLTQESTESRTAGMIENSPEIQAILNELNLTTADVCDYHLFPIADNPSPRLSADRLEYTFGNFIQYGVCGSDEIARFYGDLSAGINEHGQPEIIFNTPGIAEEFSLFSMQCSYVYISDSDRFTMEYLAEVLKRAIQEPSGLTVDDLYTTEERVIRKLKKNGINNNIWYTYTKIKAVQRTSRPIPDTFCVKVNAKRRYLDPYVKEIGRVTQFSESYRKEVDKFLAIRFDEWLSEPKA
ncbi:MAG: hypothetical protein IJM51_12195 [Clostridia bacterium]|nr:hypothetical protein [Clostridia bacterium]